ncbi:hypothetical protein NWE60_01040 [Mycoplasmopsis felis]|nr:hypothetical protein [Mycoplasmopsis felis]WAM01242.1 hypothetical protein NWE60_01040 [Mycoplasmopsis felis]
MHKAIVIIHENFREVRFYSVSEQLETLKQTYLVKETEKTNILDKLTTLIDYYKNLTDTSTNRYAVVIEKSKQLSNQLTNQKELLKSQKPEIFKEIFQNTLNQWKNLKVI